MNRRFLTKHRLAITLGLCFGIVLAGLLGVQHVFDNKQYAPTTASEFTKGEPPHKSTKSKLSSASNTGLTVPGDEKSNSSNEGSLNLLAPSGDFVSNHHPNLSGSPAPNSIASVCITTPGATCSISFTKDGVTKSLSPQTSDRGGAVYWNWKLQDIGVTSGDWTVSATSNLGDKSEHSEDSLKLEVRP